MKESGGVGIGNTVHDGDGGIVVLPYSAVNSGKSGER